MPYSGTEMSTDQLAGERNVRKPARRRGKCPQTGLPERKCHQTGLPERKMSVIPHDATSSARISGLSARTMVPLPD